MSKAAHAFTVHIESLAYGGSGIGRREDGKVVFVPFSAPGDFIRAHSRVEHSSYCEAELDEIMAPSSARILPTCPHFSLCGGCDWQHISYPEQLIWKQRILAHALIKIPRSPSFTILEPVPSQETYGYRCHTRLQYRDTPVSTLGFFRKRSHAVLDCECCPILNPRIQEALSDIRAHCKADPLRGITALDIYAPEEAVLILAHTPLRPDAHDIQVLRQLSAVPGFAGCQIQETRSGRTRTIFGDACFTYHLDIHGRTIRFSGGVGGFIQANPDINAQMVKHVLMLAQDAQRVLDLYGGCGNFGLPLADCVDEVIAVERDPRLASWGVQNAERNHAPNMHIVQTDARQALIRHGFSGFDTIVLDPPREGAKDLIPYLPPMQPKRIIYVSCNPTTLARDLGLLASRGFVLTSLRLFDMFPHTYHIECIAGLEIK